MQPTEEQQKLVTEINSSLSRLRNNVVPEADVPVEAVENPDASTVVSTPDPTKLEGIANAAVAGGNATTDAIKQYIQSAQDKETSSISAVSELQAMLGQRASDFESAYKADISPAREALSKITERISKRTAQLEQFDDQTFLGEEELRLRAAGRDMTKASFGAEATRRRLDRAIERTTAAAEIRADMAEAEFLRGNIESALDEINISLDAKYAPVEQELEIELKTLDRLRDRADAAQKVQIDQLIDQKKQEQTDIDDAKALVATVAQSGYATPEQIRAILSTDLTPQEQVAEAMQLLAAGAAEDRQRQYNAELTRLYNQSGGGNNENVNPSVDLEGVPLNEFGLPDTSSEEYMVKLLDSTSGFTTKATKDERESMARFTSVIAQTGNLIESLKTADTDPIIGTLRQLNPYDFDARAVNAQLQALVPGVARGVYGEVGVLTNQDIANYMQTLPNLTSTEEQNKFVAALTLKNAMRSFESNLRNMANSGLNVSGWKTDYLNIRRQVQQIEGELGIGSAPIDFDDEFDAFNQTEQPSGFFNTPTVKRARDFSFIGKFLFGE